MMTCTFQFTVDKCMYHKKCEGVSQSAYKLNTSLHYLKDQLVEDCCCFMEPLFFLIIAFTHTHIHLLTSAFTSYLHCYIITFAWPWACYVCPTKSWVILKSGHLLYICSRHSRNYQFSNSAVPSGNSYKAHWLSGYLQISRAAYHQV